MAKSLGEALETSAQYWMNLQSAYRLAQSEPQNEHIARRSKLYDKAPVRLMIKRNWIEGSANVDVLEKRICDFFGIKDVGQNPELIPYASRKSTAYAETTSVQLAWLYRAYRLAKAVNVARFDRARLDEALSRLRLLLPNPEEVRVIPKILSEFGIRFLIVEPLPQSKIDGVTFWLGDSPVVALSLRYDRIDYFWFTLSHELAGHVRNGDGKEMEPVLDVDLFERRDEADRPECEIEADRSATEFLVPQNELDDFVARVSPLYSKDRILGFASKIHVHPGIVVGQLQHPSRGELTYAQHREMLVRVRDIITKATLTDGWGYTLPPAL